MNICMICPEIGNAAGSAFIGGHVNNVIKLSKALANKGHEITIITTPHRHPGTMSTNNLNWAEIICLPMTGKYLSMRYGLEYAYKTLLEIKNANKHKKFDIIHGHSGYSTLGIITSISSRITQVPSVHSIYSPVRPIISRNAVMVLSNNLSSNICLCKNKKIIAASKNIFNSLISAGVPKSKIEIVPPLIDTEIHNPSNRSFSNNVRKELGISQDHQVILYVGNLTKIKGIEILIKSLKNVKKEYPSFRLVMALNMPLNKYINECANNLYNQEDNFFIKKLIASYDLGDIVVPLGIINNLPQVMSSSDIFVTPFLNTVGVVDYPLSLLEAMACGLPVISTKVGGIPEIIDHKNNGLLIEPNNVNQLEDALLFMLKNREKARMMGLNASNHIWELNNKQNIVKRYETIYENIISS